MGISPTTRRYLVQCAFAIIGNLIFFSEGIQYGWASSVLPQLSKNDSYIPITHDESKWISNCYMIGDVVGGLFSFVLFNNMSRKLSLFTSCAPILLALTGIYFANSALTLCLARFVGGVGRSMNLVAIPVYIGEISNPEIRGALGTITNTIINVGIICVTAVTTYSSIGNGAILGIVFAGTAMVLIYFIPESPYYLLMKSRKEDAEKSLKILRQSEDVAQELADLRIAVNRQTNENDTLFKKFVLLFTVRSNLKSAGIGTFLKSMQMFTGLSAIIMHCHTIFAQAGGSMSPPVSSLIYYSFMSLSCLFAFLLVERFTRRTLMIVSCLLTSLVLIVQGIYFYVNTLGYNLQFLSWLPVFNLVFFSISYRLGLGTVSIIMCSEIFAVNVKVAGGVLCNIAFSSSSLIANVIFDYTADAYGMYTPFWIFGGCSAMGAVITAFCLPETKGKTLDEIQCLLASGKNTKKEKNEIC
ncbi:hypothetical protein FQR65_LT09212 [Abscondita terminalis]|nr:hypothetical protein FQR65_LT09212 [Abscondita terminalis]